MTSRPPEGIRSLSDPPPGAARLVLVRHGQGNVNVSGRIGGIKGCTGLTPLGRDQVTALADRLVSTGELNDVSAIYASVLPRAIETAQILAPALGIAPEAIGTDCGLCELHPGDADDMIWEEYVAHFGAPDWDQDPTIAIAPNGESWVGFVDRASGALQRIAAQHGDERVLIATHAGVIESSVLQFLVDHADPLLRPRLRLRTQHASMTEWEFSSEGWRLLRYNDASHEHGVFR